MRKSKRRELSCGERDPTDYTTRNSGTTSAGCLTTDSVWNVSIRENAVDIVLIPIKGQNDYLRRLRRSTISRYRSGSRRLRKSPKRRRFFTLIINPPPVPIPFPSHHDL